MKTSLRRVEVAYFDHPGIENTEDTLRLAHKRASELEIRDVVVASTTGETGVKACQVFKGFNIVIVRHHTGFRRPGQQEMKKEYEEEILKLGGRILTASHAFSGVERGIRNKLGTIGMLTIVAETLRLFGEGVKVCVEISVMAADAGLIPVDREVISIAGTNRGADTALIIKPSNSNDFFNLTIKEIIAKPRER
ncbi:MAG: pyruvate kinase alpha/beta domain-containing protein [Candidatus Caldarchaeales archaeon]